MEAQPDRGAGWLRLRSQVSSQALLLSAPQPASTDSGECATCRGPARPGSRRCYQCGLHQEYLPGLLPDVVAPVAYAAKGGQHATNLWLYKSGRPEAGAARAALTALLLVFLRDHGSCVWQRAGMAGPTHVAVVPSRRARPGAHPLQALVVPYLRLPWARLRLACGDNTQYPDPWRFESERIRDASVLLLDDTWTSGSSAVSAAAAVKLAGARRVAVVVLGRHLDAAASGGGRFAPAQMPFRPSLCGVHRVACTSPAAVNRLEG
jgi:hypothetical protein